MFPPHVTDQARAHAAECFPTESCGLVLATLSEDTFAYEPHQNLAPNPENNFLIDSASLVNAMKSDLLRAVVHSHPHPAPPCPSASDMEAQTAFEIPWGIVPVDSAGEAAEPFFFGDQAPRPWIDRARVIGPAALTGLPYRHGVTDCYTVIRDYFLAVRNVTLPEVPRGWHGDAPAGVELDLYSKLLQPEFGFTQIAHCAALPGDVLLIMTGAAEHANHAAVLVSNDHLLHHAGGGNAWDEDKKSAIDLASRWQKHVTMVLRHCSAYKK